MPKKSKASPSQKSLNLESYIVKVGKQVNKELVLKKDAREAIHKIILCLSNNFVQTLATLVEHSRKKTVSARDVQSATRILLKGQFAKHAVSEGTKAVTKYLSFTPKKGKARVSGAEKAGLLIPPSRLASHIKKEIYEYLVETRMTESAPVYMAAVVEYVIAELIDIGRKHTVVDATHTRRLTEEVLLEAIRSDQEVLGTLCSCL